MQVRKGKVKFEVTNELGMAVAGCVDQTKRAAVPLRQRHEQFDPREPSVSEMVLRKTIQVYHFRE